MSKVNVLVVDDAPFIRDLVKKCLRNAFPGMVIEDAVNGRKAMALLGKEHFDLVLCDWEMPEMSGLELLTWCRQQPEMKALQFIMVTSRGDKENVIQAIQAGVSDFVGKPFTNEQLLTKVKKALSKIGKLDSRMDDMSTRLQSVEHELKHMPDRETISDLRVSVEGLKAGLNAMGSQTQTMAASVRRIEDYLLKAPK